MHQVLTKHANAEDRYGSDFTSQLDEGETLSNPVVVVTRGATKTYDPETGRFVPVGPWTVVTSEFVSGSPTIAGGLVSGTFKTRAAPGEQAAGTYVVRVEADTSGSRTLVDTWELEVTEAAVP